MKNILVIGAGQMGRIVWSYLYNQKDLDACIHLADLQEKHLHIPNTNEVGYYNPEDSYDSVDVRNIKQVKLENYNLVVSCVPSIFGYGYMKECAEKGINCVDLSFCEEDPFELNELARENNCLIIPDAGLAPGLTNLWVGHMLYLNHDKLYDAELSVGGVSSSPFEQYGYAVTWSVEDLEEEYKRPARYISNGKIVEAIPSNDFLDNSSLEWGIHSNTDREFQMSAFLTDGSRTLLRLKNKIKNLTEYTVRWPGTFEQHMNLISAGEFVKTIKEKCSNKNDTVIFSCVIEGEQSGIKTITMITHGTPELSAMAKTTAYTTAIIAKMVLEGLYKETGIHPLENVGENPIAFQYIKDELSQNDIVFEER